METKRYRDMTPDEKTATALSALWKMDTSNPDNRRPASTSTPPLSLAEMELIAAALSTRAASMRIATSSPLDPR